jgi:hypothetical protein
MVQEQILGPVLATMLLTIVVWVYMYSKRIPFINSLNLKPEEITPGVLAERSPPGVSNPSDNLKNLFEIPILFYAISLYLYTTASVDQTYIVAGWAFFVLRALHSAIHCTVNIVMLRFAVYALASLSVFFMIVRAAISHFI